MPERTADAGAGATGWAAGSQPCMGNSPAFTPKPSSMRKATTRSSASCPVTREGSSTPPGVKVSVLP